MTNGIDKWLTKHGLEALSATMHANDIALDILAQLTDSDLAELGISLGNRKRLLKALGETTDETALGHASPARPSERRQVTILFADLAGFTALSDQLDPEETHRLLTRYFNIVDRIVTDFGGSIDKHIGDAVMAVFGAPKSYGNDAERSVRAAIGIHDALLKFEPHIEAHIGVAGGEVLASHTGSQDHTEYTVTGPSVNLASRLQGLAKGGETLISDIVCRAVHNFAQCENRGEIQVKGLTSPVKIWSLEKLLDKRRIDTNQAYVGRKSELQQAYAIVEGVKTFGLGTVLYVRGEAGIGKTRFVDQLEKHAQALGFKCHTGLVLDFGVAQGEDAITLILQSLCSISARSGENALQSVFTELLARTPIADVDKVHVFSALGVTLSPELRTVYDAMDNEVRKSGRVRAIAALVTRAASLSPVLLRIEDVHWADEVELQALAAVAVETAEHPIVVVMTSRFEGDKIDHTWRASAGECSFSTLDLGPLRKDDALTLASSYLNATGSFAQKCIERAAGNPLFLEQLLRSKEGDAVPGSVQSIVQARLDHLNEDDANALRSASVLGQRFSLAAVRAITGNPVYSCSNLVAQNLVRPEGKDFLFTHALVRDGVHQSIMLEHRKGLHSAAANWFAERDLSLRAWHLGMAGDASAPLAYLAAAQAQSMAHRYDNAIELCKTGLKVSPARNTTFSLLALLGEIQLEANAAAASTETFESAMKIADTFGEKARTLVGLADGMRVVDRLAEAGDRIIEAIDLAGREENHVVLAKAFFLKGNLEWAKANYNECTSNHQSSLDHARAAGSNELEVQALGGLGDANYLRGRMITAKQHFLLCAKGADESGLGRIAAANRPMLAWSEIFNGKLSEAWGQAIEAREEARMIAHARAEIISLNALGLLAEERGDAASLVEFNDAAMKLAQALGSQRFIAMALLFRSWAHRIEGNQDKAVECLGAALELASQTPTFIGPWIIGNLALAADSRAQRLKRVDQGLKILQKGAVSHNHFFFHVSVIDAFINDADWAGVRCHAQLLQEYTASEPLPWSNFMIDRAYWAADRAERGGSMESNATGKELLNRGRNMGFGRSLHLLSALDEG